jgi:hypothetical protein
MSSKDIQTFRTAFLDPIVLPRGSPIMLPTSARCLFLHGRGYKFSVSRRLHCVWQSSSNCRYRNVCTINFPGFYRLLILSHSIYSSWEMLHAYVQYITMSRNNPEPWRSLCVLSGVWPASGVLYIHTLALFQSLDCSAPAATNSYV